MHTMHLDIISFFIHELLTNRAMYTHTNKDPLIHAATSPHTDVF